MSPASESSIAFARAVSTLVNDAIASGLVSSVPPRRSLFTTLAYAGLKLLPTRAALASPPGLNASTLFNISSNAGSLLSINPPNASPAFFCNPRIVESRLPLIFP